MTAAPDVRYVDSGGTAIAFSCVGVGERHIVLMPNLVWQQDVVWEDPAAARFLQRLASMGRLALWDRREQGLSDRTGCIPTVEQDVDDVVAVMDAAGVRRATVVGLSEGCATAAGLAAGHPERVEALAL